MALDAVMIVLSIFLLLGTGMFLTHRGWIDAGGAKLLARLTVSVGMPGLVLNNVLTQFDRQGLASSLWAILVCYLSMGLSVLLSWGAARLIAIPVKRRGAFMCAFSFSNCVFIGLPVAVALFGEEATPYALIYYIANTSLFWSLGNYLLARDGGGKGRLDLKKLIPAPLVAFVLGVAMVLLGLTLPPFVLSACQYLGALVTPLSLIYTGYVVMGMIKARQVRWEKGYGVILLARFLLTPALTWLCAQFIPVSGQVLPVLLIQTAMPVMASVAIAAGDQGADAPYVAGSIALSTFAFLATLPILSAVMPYIA